MATSRVQTSCRSGEGWTSPGYSVQDMLYEAQRRTSQLHPLYCSVEKSHRIFREIHF